MKIYTRTGDKGETSLFTGERVLKNTPIIEAIGTVDECNSAIGVADSFLPTEKKFDIIRNQFEIIQHTLFDLGAALASNTLFNEDTITLLENWMDEMEKDLPELKNFILPGGNPCAAHLHLARSICRRAERLIVPINKPKILIYLNRLSDYLFMASRYVNFLTENPEKIWKKKHGTL